MIMMNEESFVSPPCVHREPFVKPHTTVVFPGQTDGQPTRQIVRGFYLELTWTHKTHRETQSGVVVWQLRNRYLVECTD